MSNFYLVEEIYPSCMFFRLTKAHPERDLIYELSSAYRGPYAFLGSKRIRYAAFSFNGEGAFQPKTNVSTEAFQYVVRMCRRDTGQTFEKGAFQFFSDASAFKDWLIDHYRPCGDEVACVVNKTYSDEEARRAAKEKPAANPYSQDSCFDFVYNTLNELKKLNGGILPIVDFDVSVHELCGLLTGYVDHGGNDLLHLMTMMDFDEERTSVESCRYPEGGDVFALKQWVNFHKITPAQLANSLWTVIEQLRLDIDLA